MQKILIIGSGGLAREVSDWIKGFFEIAGYATREPDGCRQFAMQGECFNDDVDPRRAGTDLAIIAVGSPRLKMKLFTMFMDRGFSFPVVIHPSVSVAASANIGAGSVVAPGCVVSSGCRVGVGSYVNFMVGLGHESVLGNFCQINPGAQVGGLATIGDRVLVGSGATILNGIHVNVDATIASGAVIFNRVPANALMLGNPAKRMRALEQ